MIDKETYKLQESHYLNVETTKKRIVIGNSFSIDMNHYNGWLNRYNGKYKKTSMYTITIDGKIYEHFNPKYSSEIIDKKDFDESTITILLENEGWLIKDLNDENRYITYVGNIYNRIDEVFVKKWRHNKYWSPYSQKQLDSTVYLINKLSSFWIYSVIIYISNYFIVHEMIQIRAGVASGFNSSTFRFHRK